ncbi:MAG: hypothetical protein VB141_07325, partial [Burkholderia gladioli]
AGFHPASLKPNAVPAPRARGIRFAIEVENIAAKWFFRSAPSSGKAMHAGPEGNPGPPRRPASRLASVVFQAIIPVDFQPRQNPIFYQRR